MSPASRGLAPLAVAALLLGALVLRLWGLEHGLPYAYNADENAHFVPRAIGMFGHSLNPGYFINPPAYTYVLHGVFWVWFGGGNDVARTHATDPGAVFAVARVVTAVLGTVAVALLLAAGARLFDRRVGFLAAALLAVAFLPVFYSHLALNDVPALAPLCLALLGVAGVARRGRRLDYALAGVGLGLGAATKYTAGIVLVCLLGAAAVHAARGRRAALSGLVLAGALSGLAFVAANPYALFDLDGFRHGLARQSSASQEAGGKLGLTWENGWLYYLHVTTWGLGWVPALAAAAGAVGLALRDRAGALVLVPAPLLFVVFMGAQERFFGRWLLPVLPVLCLLAAWAAVAAADRLARARPRLAPAALAAVALALLTQGLLYSIHNDRVLARADTRNLARAWLVAHVPEGSKMVVEPFMPDAWAHDPGRPSPRTRNGNRWIKWRTSRSLVNDDGTLRKTGRVVHLEDYERTTRPQLVSSYARGGFCWVVIGSTQFGRALAEPDEVPRAIAYYRELERRGRLVYRISPFDSGARSVPFSFDFSFNFYPLAYARPGPEIKVYRLREADCA